jgi:hypothetical protein
VDEVGDVEMAGIRASKNNETSGEPFISSDSSPDAWADLWEAYGEAFLVERTGESKSSRGDEGTREASSSEKPSHGAPPISGTSIGTIAVNVDNATTAVSEQALLDTSLERPSFGYLVYLHAYRGMLQRFKSSTLFICCFVHILGGAILGIITCGGPLLT